MTSKVETYKSSKVRLVKPYPITHHFKPGDEFLGQSLSDMMSSRFPFRSQAAWDERITSGKVGVNEEKVASTYILTKQDEVFHHNPNVIEPSVPDEVEILQETNDYLIVFKPAPMPMHPGGRYFKNTLTAILEEMGFTDLRIVHRLDAVTSGIVLFAKNKTFAKEAMQQFQSGKVEKMYYAEASGVPDEDEMIINESIRRKQGFVFESGENLDGAKEAETKFKVVERRQNSSIIACYPKTGRTHQIRLHLKAWGYPIIDDPIYGPNGDESSSRTQNIGISLKNARLSCNQIGIHAELDIPEWN